MLLSLAFFCLILSAAYAAGTNYPLDLIELEKYANLASVAYCIEKGLDVGLVRSQGPACPSIACQHPWALKLLVVKTFNFLGFLEVGSGFVALDQSAKKIFLVFRGTLSTQDWINNLDAFPVSYEPMVQRDPDFKPTGPTCDGCRVHKGMNAFLKVNAKSIIQTLVQLKTDWPFYSLVVAGHSQGGALALLSGIELRLLGYNVLIVTMGAPKIGDENFASFVDTIFKTDDVVEHISGRKSFDSLPVGFIRMVKRHDIVPYLPPVSYYKHSGYEYYLGAEGLKQTPDTLVRKGTNYVENEVTDYLEKLPSFRRMDHAGYFLQVSHCI